tara:strand:+ start:103 stop:297 length:195 start_codon:yes stop_codon:yes gene_type:complete
MTANISEFERTKPIETLKQIKLLIKMQKDNDKRVRGNTGARVSGKWLVFREELEKLEALFLSGE